MKTGCLVFGVRCSVFGIRCLVKSVTLLMAAGLLVVPPVVHAQEAGKPKPPVGTTPASSGSSPVGGSGATGKPTGTMTAATMQIRREITGNFLCRFVTTADESAPLVALPAPVGTDNVVAVPVPSTIKAKDALLEVVDTDHSRVARLPVNITSVTALNDSAFKLVQTVLIPVQVKGKGGVTAATVTLASGDKSYNKSVTLTPVDAGTAKFTNVPLGKPITATVQEGANAPLSMTQTLTVPASAEGYKWPTMEVTWPDVRTVPLPSTTPFPTTPTASTGGAPILPISPTTVPIIPNAPANTDSAFSGIVSTVVSLLFLGGIGYGLYWAYQNGHLKSLLDKLGINTQPVAAGGPQISPFDKPQKAPIQPITDGTAEPPGGSNFAGSGAMASPPVASGGPRLVATMGTYPGNIFPLSGQSLDIGRDATNGIPLPQDTNASRRHATLQMTGGQATLLDNGSSNGTFVNGVRIPAQTPHPLNPGDEVQIGMTRFRFEQ